MAPFYDILAEDVVQSLDYIAWQTYELGHSGLDDFFTGYGESAVTIRKYLKRY